MLTPDEGFSNRGPHNSDFGMEEFAEIYVFARFAFGLWHVDCVLNFLAAMG